MKLLGRPRLRRDNRGATIIEFAIVAPVMCMLMMGLGDILYQAYAKSILNGAVQKAGRDSGLQGGADQTDTLDNRVIAMLGTLVHNPVKNCGAYPGGSTWCSTRESYSNFAAIGPEPFTDTNGNGIRDAKECYTDINGNAQWDADPGSIGQGGANDVTVYTMNVTYPRVFPIASLLGWANTMTITSTTILKNQPYQTQSVTTPVTICK